MILQEKVAGAIEVSAVNPIAFMLAVNNMDLTDITNEVSDKLQEVVANL